MVEVTPSNAVGAARDATAAAVARLTAAGIAPERLGAIDPARRILGLFPRAERVRGAGEGWRLGVMVLTTDGDLVLHATTTRSKRPARVGYSAESARERDALRHAAFRGGFAEGVTVHVGGIHVDLAALANTHDSGGQSGAEPRELLTLRDGEFVVRWAPSVAIEAAIPLRVYLDERVDLAISPPGGAS